MKTGSAEPAEARVLAILDEYLAELRAGRAPDRMALLARHPDLADSLAASFRALDFVHDAGRTLEIPEAADPPGRDEPNCAGRMLGDYRLLREIGRGGMAVVYEAEQISLGRSVALKVLPFAAVLDPKRLQRFKNEAQAAAHLHHPHIVPVHAVGCERGVHYYAMHYVEGQSLAVAIRDMKEGGTGERTRTPITSHGSNREPAYIRMAAALGVQAAEALDHAHQLGIVHRDVKPGNLLVDLAGTLWVTDFGLAHSLKDVGLTITGELLGTIRYMSPEQALAKRVPIDHRTDIYSLGVTLYELLTLAPAFAGDDAHLLLQDIAFKEPALPRRLNQAIPRDLETVLLKAMSKDPGGRYATAREMADDLRRYLENRAIEAKRPGLLRRAAKWSQRHRALVGAAAVMLLLVVAGLAIGAALLWREQQRTLTAFQRAQANLALALKALDQIYIDEAEGHPKLREGLPRDLLERGLGFYEAFVEENARNWKGMLPMLGVAHGRAGLIYRKLGQEERAIQSLDRAISMYDRALDIDPRDIVATHNRGITLGDLGRFEEKLAACNRALELDPQDVDAHNSRGAVLCDYLGRPSDALVEFDLALQLDPRNVVARNNRGHALLRLGRVEEAIAAYDRTLEIDPRNAIAHLSRGTVVCQNLGRPGDALADLDRAIEIDQLDSRPHVVRGNALIALGRFEEALEDFDRAIDIEAHCILAHVGRCNALIALGRFEEALAASDRALEIDGQYAVAHCNRAIALKSLMRLDEALAAYRRAASIDPRNADIHCGLAGLLTTKGEFEAAIGAYHEAIRLDPDLYRAHYNLGFALYAKGDLEGAIASYCDAIRVEPNRAEAHSGLGIALGDKGDLDGAIASCRKAVRLEPGKAAWHVNLGAAFMAKRDSDGAIGSYREAARLAPDHAIAHCNLGRALVSQGRFQEALPWLRRGHELGSKQPNWSNPSKRWVDDAERMAEMEGRLDQVSSGAEPPLDAPERIAFAELLRAKSRHAEAAQMWAQAFAADPALAEDLAKYHRYNAARSAALAAAGGGEDAAERRGQALEWLRADLAAHDRAATGLVAALEYWKKDADLASVRDRAGELPEAERAAWQRLWAAVDEALTNARQAPK